MRNENSDRRLIESYIYSRLPKELQGITSSFEGREKDIVLLSTLGVLSNCFPNVWGIYDGDRVFPHLYIMIIAPAASGKGVMNYSRKIIEPIHDKIFNESRSAFLECEASNKKTKSNKEVCPEIQVKILPANISTSEMYTYMGSSNYGLLIMESEADTMSNMLKNDWSNYSDVLRKAFHHEPVSISRKIEKVFEDIKEPKLAMVISGTPDQLQPLIKSKENGLFSRFIVYNFDEMSEFKNVFDRSKTSGKWKFEEFGKEILNFYQRLIDLDSVQVLLTEKQEQKFLDRIRPIRQDIVDNHSEGFISNLHRHGLILFRLAMILTVLRNKKKLMSENVKELYCSDTDFMLALKLTQRLLRHSLFTYNTIDNGGLSLQDVELLDFLKSSFTSQEAYKAGEVNAIPKRTIVSKLEQWQKKKVIKRVKKGFYKKT
ncbi:hypothetical protein MHTCC0001_28450 [Flavobacteriaceae bacterium MHTCC 0001]